MARPIGQHPYTSFVQRVQKPARYLGGEHGEVVKDWGAAACRMCLAFPDLYEVGMSHLGFKILYGVLNQHPKLLAERAYAPWQDMEAELRAHREPLRSLESWRALRDFDVVGFSLQFELTFTNVLLMLDLGGIPLRSSERSEQDPLVIAGGPTATHPEPVAPFIDAFVIGDGEAKTPELLLTWSALTRAGLPRRERLIRLAALGGVYVPSLYATELEPETGLLVVSRPVVAEAPLPIQRALVADLSEHPYPSDGPVANSETVFDRVSVEIARGCTEGCRFCQAGMIYRPVRERDPQHIVDVVRRTVREGGYDEASLTSLSTADYSAIAPLVRKVARELKQENVSLSVSSLRAYGLAGGLLDELRSVRAGGLTFAPEAGTQRMRDVVNKNVTEEQLLETARRVFERGWGKMKLYFMLGLPTEQDEDVQGIVRTGARAQRVGREVSGRYPQVTVSVSTHVPKPHTPFQWCAMDPLDEIQRKQGLLREQARRTRVKLRMHASHGSWLEGVLARGDRRLARVIECAYRGGARFDSWEERLEPEVWRQAFARAGVDPTASLRTLPVSARLPWDHIDVGLEDGFLAREYRKALRDRLSPPCGKAVGAFVHSSNLKEARADRRRLVCYDCGIACDLDEMRHTRESYLRALGALEPEAEHAQAGSLVGSRQHDPGVVGDTPGGTGRAASMGRTGSTGNGSRSTGSESQEPARLRLGYRKLGRVAFLSHLDLVRMLPRVFRRAGLSLRCSAGFHPKPLLTFGPALAVGTSSLAEYVDLKLAGTGPLDSQQLLQELGRVCATGLEFFVVRSLAAHDASLSRLVDEATYVAALPAVVLQAANVASPDALARLIAHRYRSADLRVLRHATKRRRAGRVPEPATLDVRESLVELGLSCDPGGEATQSNRLAVAHDSAVNDALERAGVAGACLALSLRVRLTAPTTARPREILEALSGVPDLPARWVRTGCFAVRGSLRIVPTDLDRLRPRAPGAHVGPGWATCS